jgi:hypothetical protein
MRCEDYKELQNLILDLEVKPLRRKIPNSEYQELWSGSSDKAKQIWEELLEKNKKFYKKDGYLEIEYLSYKKIYRRKPLSKGQPKKSEDDIKDKRLTIRINSELQEILNNYCQTFNVTESEAIRRAIQDLRFKKY